jgi:hypothetical protein
MSTHTISNKQELTYDVIMHDIKSVCHPNDNIGVNWPFVTAMINIMDTHFTQITKSSTLTHDTSPISLDGSPYMDHFHMLCSHHGISPTSFDAKTSEHIITHLYNVRVGLLRGALASNKEKRSTLNKADLTHALKVVGKFV